MPVDAASSANRSNAAAEASRRAATPDVRQASPAQVAAPTSPAVGAHQGTCSFEVINVKGGAGGTGSGTKIGCDGFDQPELPTVREA